MEESMAKVRIYELAKEIDKSGNEILSFLQEKGIGAKTSSSSVDEDVADMVRSHFKAGKKDNAASVKTDTDKPMKKAEKETNKQIEETDKQIEKETGKELKSEMKPEVKSETKTELKQEQVSAAKAEEVRDDAHTDDARNKKKKNIIFVSNPQNSKFQGQRPNQNQNASQGRQSNGQNQNAGQNRQQNAQRGSQRQNGYGNNNLGPRVPVRPIKPLTPPSPTPSVQMVPENKGQSKRPQQPDEHKNNQTAQNTQNVQNNQGTQKIQNVQSSQNAQTVQNTQKAQSTQNAQARPAGNERPVRENRDNRDNGNSRDRRSQNSGSQDSRNNRDFRQQGSRQQSQGTDNRYQNRGGSENGRPQGDRQNGFQRPFRQNQEGGQNSRRDNAGGAGNNRSFGSNDRIGRGSERQGNQFRDNRDSKQGKSFVPETGGKDMEKKREEDKRRFSQEKDKRSKKDHIYEEEESVKSRPGRFIKPEKKKEEKVEEVIKVITVGDSITIKDLADKMKIQAAAIVKKLFLEGKVVTVNQEISYEDAENIAMDYEILCEKEVKVDVIEELLKEEEENETDLVERPPVICVMGHVDHGKTSLLDAIRKTNVTDKEAGGITQHIGAYTVNVGGRSITFLDTPGHEAFTSMRMRGANSTDIAILVVAADDGVMPQTVEAINHAKAAGIEIIVAVNKIDKPSANIDRVKQELSEYELIPEDWGGSTVFAPVSAKTGEGIDQLLEMILLSADILELKANPKRRARGLVIEAELDKGRGPVATVLVQKGTLKVGDFISAGASHGKVRAMIDDKGRRVKEATPSTPVEILGLSAVPGAGEVFIAHDSDKEAKSYADTYLAQNKEKKLEETKTRMSLEDLFSQIKEGNLKELNLIVKADVQGSVEAVKQSLIKLSNEEVVVKCIHGGVGAINESDVVLAGASNAIIIGFNVRPDATAKATAEREGVDVRLYNVIYQAIEDVEAAMKGMLDPVYEEKIIGHAEVRQIFKASAIGNIAGAYVLDGEFQRGCKVRITREGEQIFEGNLASLKRFKDDVKEVKTGFECGLVFEGFDKMQELDIVEAYIMVEVPR
jgi:translation initiation factor IF-2